MNWSYSLTATEFGFSAIFLGLYIFYFFRMFRVAHQLHATPWAVIPKFFLRSGYLALLLIALLGPSFGKTEKDLMTEGKEIYVAVDLSKSMDATDLPPSRLQKIKFELNRFIEALPNSRFGLLVFSTDAYIHAPLTSDQQALKSFIHSMETRLVPEQGTNICSSIDLAIRKHLQESTATPLTKAIVILTDGEDFGQCDYSLLKRIHMYNLSVFIVGVGTEGGSAIPTENGFVQDSDGRVVRSRLNRELLHKLTRDTQGSYFELNSTSGDLTGLITAINGLENHPIDQRRLPVNSNKYYYFLMAALFLIAVDVIVAVRTFNL